jgi:Tol biopolymer transport system component
MLTIVSVIITGCDFCANYNGDYVMEESDIYFTSIPVNSNVTSIFRISADGRNIREIWRNAQIYSEPSKTKKIVFTSMIQPDVKFIYKANIDGTSPEVVKNELFSNDKLYPILSSNGKYIAVNDVATGLWIIYEDKTDLKISSDFCNGTLPAFSPDGTRIAFYEGGYLTNPLSVVVMDLNQNPPVVLSRKLHSTGLNNYRGEATISWSEDGTKICYVISESEVTDVIYVGDYNTENELGYAVVSVGAYQPSLSKDLTKVAFAARDGNLWIRQLADTGKVLKNITMSGKISTSLYPEWSKDGKSLLYVKYFKDDLETMHASLEIVDISSELFNTIILSNNVFKGYWNRR